MSGEVPTRVLVKDTDMISAKSLLELLSDSIQGMKKQQTENDKLSDDNKMAINGAIEALSDLHNMILGQLQDVRTAEAFDTDDTDRGGKFDA